MRIEIITFNKAMQIMRQLTLAHWDEVGFKEGNLELNLDEEVYATMESAGNARFYIAYDGDVVAGYISILASTMVQHKDVMQAVTDSFYVVPEYRGAGVLQKLIEYIEQDCITHGITFLAIAFPPERARATGKFLKRMGYAPREITYSKYLGE